MTVSASALRRPRAAIVPPALARALRAPWLRVLGPAFAVSIGYIDPGNWATDLAAGAFGYRLVWVVLVANAIALVLQVAVAELTAACRADLATLIVRRWPRAVRPSWLIFQGAAIATDVAEFAGIVLGIELLFRCSVPVAVLAGAAVVFAVLCAGDRSSKGLEIAAIGALALVGTACAAQLPALHPAWGALAAGALVPHIPRGSVVVLVGIVGATVMPHNLFLHAALVRRACALRPDTERRALARIFGRETFVALNLAALVNVALVVVGAALGGAGGSLQNAFETLARTAGAAALLFGGGLLLSGLAASTTATAAGDEIFAAFSPRPFPRLARRALTLLPAALLLVCGADIGTLLVWSQVALALVLPAALVPLVALLAQHRRTIRRGRAIACATAAAALVCVAFDAVMLAQMVRG